MKVHAHFPTACRAEQAVHAPPERAERPDRAERPSGWRASVAGDASRPGATLQEDVSVLGRRRGRAFPTTRPHPGGPAHGHGIGP